MGLWFWDLARKMKDAKMEGETFSEGPIRQILTCRSMYVSSTREYCNQLQITWPPFGISQGGSSSKHRSPSAEQYGTEAVIPHD